MGNRYSEEHQFKPGLGAQLPKLAPKAFNRTPAGIPLDEWNKIQNARKRARRARKGKR